MSSQIISVYSWESNAPAEAVLHQELHADKVSATAAEWNALRIRPPVKKIHSVSWPEHSHWDWQRKSKKLSLLAYRCMGIEIASEFQGLMLLKVAGVFSRLDFGKPIIYIDYLEVAPWNLKQFTETPRYGAVGTRLIEAAIRLSQDEEMKGRVGLHSLPQAEDFYRNRCLMTPIERDPDAGGLMYYELSQDAARKFLGDAAR